MVIQEQKQSLGEHHLGMIWVLTSEAAASTYQPACSIAIAFKALGFNVTKF